MASLLTTTVNGNAVSYGDIRTSGSPNTVSANTCSKSSCSGEDLDVVTLGFVKPGFSRLREPGGTANATVSATVGTISTPAPFHAYELNLVFVSTYAGNMEGFSYIVSRDTMNQLEGIAHEATNVGCCYTTKNNANKNTVQFSLSGNSSTGAITLTLKNIIGKYGSTNYPVICYYQFRKSGSSTSMY